MITREMLPTLRSVVKQKAVNASVYSLLIWGVLNLGFWFFLGADDRAFLKSLPSASVDTFILANGGAIIGALMLLIGMAGMLVRVPAVLLFDGFMLLLLGAWNIGFDFYAMHVLQSYGYSYKPVLPIWIVFGATQLVWGLRQISRYGKVSCWGKTSVRRHEVDQFKKALSAWIKQPQKVAEGLLRATITLRGIIPQTENYIGRIDSDCAIFVSNKMDYCFVIDRNADLLGVPDSNGALRLATDVGVKSIAFEAQSLAALQYWALRRSAGLDVALQDGQQREHPETFPVQQMDANSFPSPANSPEMIQSQAAAKRSTGNLGDWLERDGSANTRSPEARPVPAHRAKSQEPPGSEADGSSSDSRSLARESGGLAEWMKTSRGAQGPSAEDREADSQSPAAVHSSPAHLVEKSPDAEISTIGKPMPPGIYAHFLLIDIASPVREIRGVPRYLPLKEVPTLLGRYEKAHIHLDDPGTVQLKHATVDLQRLNNESVFVVRPIEDARVMVNDKPVTTAGIALKSEDRIQIGSAKLIFFQKDLNASFAD